MNNLKKFGAIALILGLALSSCKKKEEDDNTGVLALLYAATAKSITCETSGKTLTASDLSSASSTAICTPTAGTAKHFRVEGLEITGNTFYLNIGNAAADTAATIAAAPTGNVVQLYFYPSFTAGPTPAPIYAVRYAPNNSASSGVRANITGLSSAVTSTSTNTICWDVNDATPSRVTVWVDGVNGATCSNVLTLTTATSVLNKKDWNTTSQLDTRNAYISFAAGAAGGSSKFTKVIASSVLAVQD